MSDSKQHSQLYIFRFGDSEFDEARFELSVGGTRADVQRKPLEVLALLLRSVNEVVTREELLERLWDGRPTVEHVINNALAKLRSALGPVDGARIVTRPRVGYLFQGPVQKAAVGRVPLSAFEFSPGTAVPKRENFILSAQIGQTGGNEIWLAVNPKTAERRVYKFCLDGGSLAALKRESSLARVLRENLGEHPHLVKMLDWNFESAPFFIEYAYGGVNLARWSEGGRLETLTLGERLSLFLMIADAVAAAHSVGVLHKDLKPSNILIAEQASGPQAQVADFGSGGLLDHAAAADITYLELARSLSTHPDTISGTAMYIAPELLAGRPATIQSDVYALGILLYQFVSARMGAPLAPGWERQIDDPLLAGDIAEATDGEVARRLPGAAVLAERVRGLEARRHEAATRADTERRIALARETLRIRRVRRPWILAAFGVLVLGLGVSFLLYLRERHTREQLTLSQQVVRQEADRTASVLRFLQDSVLSASDPFQDEDARRQTVQGALATAISRLDTKPPADARTEAAMRMALGSILVRIAEPALAEEQYRRVIALVGNDAGSRLPLAQSHYALAQALTVQSRFADAEQELRTADQLRAGLEDARTARNAEASWGSFYMDQQQCAKGVPFLQRAVKLTAAGGETDYWDGDLARISLGQCYNGLSQFAEAERLSRELLDSLAQRASPSLLTRALAQSVLGESLMYQGRYPEAGPLIETAYQMMLERLGLGNIRTFSTLNLRCNLYFMTKQLDRSLACLQQGYEAARQRFGDKNWATWEALSNIGTVYFMLAQYANAARTLDAARSGLEATLGADKPATLLCDYYMAYALLKQHQLARAEPLAARLVPAMLEEAEPGAPWNGRITLLRALIDIEQGRRAGAVAQIEQTLQSQAMANDTEDTITLDARAVVAREYTLLHHKDPSCPPPICPK